MIITPLGHTEFLVDIENSDGRNVRILVDSWLSDYAVGDLMERSAHVRLDPERLASIDAIYISHAHCDHFDPYTLVEIYRHASPLLILPFTLKYLEPLLSEYLPTASVHWLANHEIYTLHGIELTGTMFPQDEITNEDDVMTLAIANKTEFLFAEIDTLPPDTPEVHKMLYRLFTRREYTTRLYLASRNELEGNLKILDFPTANAQDKFRREYIAERKDMIEWDYAKWSEEEYESLPNIMTLPGYSRGYIGQGIIYPRSLSDTLSTMTAMTLTDVVDRESSLAEVYGYQFSQKALLPGRQYRIIDGQIETGRKECPIGELIKEPTGDRGQSTERIYANGPLSADKSWNESHIANILNILNTRFLPYWSASPVASLRSALIVDPIYTISINGNGEARYFVYSCGQLEFQVTESISSGQKIHETYYLADILDFLEGRQELYSNFWHQLDPKQIYRLWTCLGANFLCHDLVFAKYALHFQRAHHGDTSRDFVEGILRDLQK